MFKQSRKLSQQQPDLVSVYYRSDYKWCVNIQYNRGTTIRDIQNEVIKLLKLNDKLVYQMLLLTHCCKAPAEGKINVKRRLRMDDQPFKIFFEHNYFKMSLYIDYSYNQQSNVNSESIIILDEQRYEKEFKIKKVTSDQSTKTITLRINSNGISLGQKGSMINLLIRQEMDKAVLYSACRFEFDQDLAFTLSFDDKIRIYQAMNKSDFCSIAKFIKKYNNNTELLHYFMDLDKKIQSLVDKTINKLEYSCQCLGSKAQLHQYSDYKQFMEVLKQTQTLKDTTNIESNDMNINLECYRPQFLETMSILPREKYRNALINFNSQFKYIASCKIEDQIEEQSSLVQPIEDVLVSQEQIERFSQFLQ